MQNERIRAISDAATRLFLQNGYARTQISHIAKAAGVSVGTIYHDFAGKREIMHFVLKTTIDPDFADREFARPITDDLFAGLDDEIMSTFRRTGDMWGKNLDQAGAGYGFDELISDAFDLLSKYAVGCLFIEKNYADCGPLAEAYTQYRKQFFSTMADYMERFIQRGIVRPLDNVVLTTSLIIEILTWWAMDVRYISFAALDVSPEEAKAVCMDNILSAYLLNSQ